MVRLVEVAATTARRSTNPTHFCSIRSASGSQRGNAGIELRRRVDERPPSAPQIVRAASLDRKEKLSAASVRNWPGARIERPLRGRVWARFSVSAISLAS
jgi:hypothetical protein